ncbi:hypothetical protein VOLCADRAFT_90142 [Volvox carteri f. nagariensis]|uniref:Cytosol aminopeptidase domain-containing protein n=1 Tax=Volvox carteri f. nagariensis TaxID=3068 RepID=D8TTK9_VOLCA|nr:uncharacterized protein VOLCADRAFT_90142 [Volvox carteri f. nagariensis]EFJ49217.1 hypothetical protein VOLCADRAFT_90142 [Volvox carteri f. nagariensis]|eukprot:XP_002949665.1 hypothetical protein VOLCADRAFT_90142 [Volvox carteri f. nagariensis]
MASTVSDISSQAYWFSRSGRYDELLVDGSGDNVAIPVQAVAQSDLGPLLTSLEAPHRCWATTSKFTAKSGEMCLLPDPQGGLSRVLLGLGPSPSSVPWPYAVLAKLPGGTYRLAQSDSGGADGADGADGAVAEAAERATLGFLLGHYAFERYKGPRGPRGVAAAAAAERRGGGEEPRGGEVGVEGAEGAEGEPKARLVWPAGCRSTYLNCVELLHLHDMGGAALVLALAHLVMSCRLRVRLLVLIPAVENSVSGNSYRPLDVLRTRAGIYVESDPLWRLPLHPPYRRLLDSKVADLASTGPGDGLAGAILAALFLQEFVQGAQRWVHIDTSAFTAGSAVVPGRPEGGEAQALRAVWRMLQYRYGTLLEQ